MTQHIAKDVASVITLLGGINKAAELLGCQTTTLRMWKTRGRIPASLLTAHQRILSEHGLQADPYLWGQRSIKAAE
jgi:hypothetical protein